MNSAKVKQICTRVENAVLLGGQTSVGLFAMTAVLVGAGVASAAGDPTELMELVIKFLGALTMVMGGIFGILGIVHYAAAHSEGDGPAKTKAMGQIAAGVMLIVLSILLTNNANDIATKITPDLN